jgi:hypothetical protein
MGIEIPQDHTQDDSMINSVVKMNVELEYRGSLELVKQKLKNYEWNGYDDEISPDQKLNFFRCLVNDNTPLISIDLSTKIDSDYPDAYQPMIGLTKNQEGLLANDAKMEYYKTLVENYLTAVGKESPSKKIASSVYNLIDSTYLNRSIYEFSSELPQWEWYVNEMEKRFHSGVIDYVNQEEQKVEDWHKLDEASKLMTNMHELIDAYDKDSFTWKNKISRHLAGTASVSFGNWDGAMVLPINQKGFDYIRLMTLIDPSSCTAEGWLWYNRRNEGDTIHSAARQVNIKNKITR